VQLAKTAETLEPQGFEGKSVCRCEGIFDAIEQEIRRLVGQNGGMDVAKEATGNAVV
jgi:hypothetical protein